MSHRVLTKRKNKNRSKAGYFLLASIFILFLCVLILPQFYIYSIEINGLRILNEERLIEKSKLKIGDHIFKGISGSLKNIFSMRHSQREEDILDSCPYVKSVVVRSDFPGKIYIEIVERIEVAYIAINDGFVIIDSEGIAVEVLEKSTDLNIPVIEGIQVSYCETGSEVKVDMQEFLNQSIVLLNNIVNADKDSRSDINLLEKILSIRPVNDRISFVLLQLEEEQIIVKVKTSEKTLEDMLWLRFAIQQGVLEGNSGKILDLTTSQRAFRDE